ncbi:MAG: ribonuclease Z [Desulfobacterales bacterium]|nr:ribonuclease Z [Desulfobacterales bacterium]MDJ0913047.1 ribonuclease Z [Desulfobacterales bacterium]
MTKGGADTHVTILGSGTCVPSLKRSACSVLIETGMAVILIDAGPGTIRRLLHANKTIFDITHILFSHFHPDHTAELVPLLFATKYPNSDRRQTPLTIIAGNGLNTFLKNLMSAYNNWLDLPRGILNTIEMDTTRFDSRTFSDFHLETTPVKHNPESIAYRINSHQHKSIVYSGDTDFCESLVQLAQETDVFICESSHPDHLKVPGHLSPSVAGEIAVRASAGRLILTHFYPECDQADILKECRQAYSGPLALAEDLMRINLK